MASSKTKTTPGSTASAVADTRLKREHRAMKRALLDLFRYHEYDGDITCRFREEVDVTDNLPPFIVAEARELRMRELASIDRIRRKGLRLFQKSARSAGS